MDIRIPKADIERFRTTFGTEQYLHDERSYKEAAHLAVSTLLTPPLIDAPEFPRLLGAVLQGDHTALPNANEISNWLRKGNSRDVRTCLANLAGGKWGAQQLLWIPRAIDYGLGEDLRAVFGRLVGPEPLADRVDAFRDELYAVEGRLQALGGFQPQWRMLPISLAIVAAFLGSQDPSRYTYYAKEPLRRAFADFNVPWPTGTAGKRYTVICEFVAGVRDRLAQAGIPVQDLIDAQSFLWLRAKRAEAPEATPSGRPRPETRGVAGTATGTRSARPAPPSTADLRAMVNDLAESSYWPAERARELIRLAWNSHQLLFEGPPGTGKTFLAERLAAVLTGEDENLFEVVQFHPSYAYEDFIEGIRPKVTEDARALLYEIRAGVFLDLADRARQDPDRLFVLVIDEMNRANLPRVFGELLYGLEYRGPDRPFRLPYSGRETYVPENILVIGTMNSADRSIALVDAAIRRRFRHRWFQPDPEVLRRWLQQQVDAGMARLAVERLKRLNGRLEELLGPDRLVGHSYLMRKDLREVGFETVWSEALEPILREHLFNRPGALDETRAIFVEGR